MPLPLPLPIPIPIPIVKHKHLLHLLLPKLPRIGITVHLGKGHSPLHHLHHLRHHKPKLIHVDHVEPEYHSHASHSHPHGGPSHHSAEEEVYEVKNPPAYPSKDWKS